MKSNVFSEKLSGKGLTIALVVARFNRHITKRLEQAARRALKKSGVREKDILVLYAPGSFEMPVIADRILAKKKVSAIVCLGAVIRGETPHHGHIARAAALGIMGLNIKYGVPVAFGVLTTNTLKQALARSKPDANNAGYGAAMSALETALLLRKL